MKLFRIMNSFGVVAGLAGAVVCADFAWQDFCAHSVKAVALDAFGAVVCLVCAWASAKLIDVIDKIEKEDEDEAED